MGITVVVALMHQSAYADSTSGWLLLICRLLVNVGDLSLVKFGFQRLITSCVCRNIGAKSERIYRMDWYSLKFPQAAQGTWREEYGCATADIYTHEVIGIGDFIWVGVKASEHRMALGQSP